jgi:hypothetical protein
VPEKESNTEWSETTAVTTAGTEDGSKTSIGFAGAVSPSSFVPKAKSDVVTGRSGRFDGNGMTSF